MKKILFLGYSKKKTSLIDFLKNKKITVKQFSKNITITDTIGCDFIISFGYRYIIKKKILDKFPKSAINIHISYLPYNKGAHPNFWSFIDNTPKGVSIHYLSEKVDDGEILFRKKINFKISEKNTFKDTYKILFKNAEKLFKINYKKILFEDIKGKKYKNQGSHHFKRDLPKNISWNDKILVTKKLLQISKKN